jgi:hypothetical protein
LGEIRNPYIDLEVGVRWKVKASLESGAQGVIKQDAPTWLRKRDDDKSFSDHVDRKGAAKIVWKLTPWS